MSCRAAYADLSYRVHGSDEQRSALDREIAVACAVAPCRSVPGHVVDDVLTRLLVDLLDHCICECVGDERLHRVGNVQLLQESVSRGRQRRADHSRLVAATEVLRDVVTLKLEIAVGEENLPAASLDIEHTPNKLRARFF